MTPRMSTSDASVHIHSSIINGVNGVNGTNGFKGIANANMNGTSMSNGASAQRHRSRLTKSDPSDIHDVICVGFGPASLAIAVALHDALGNGSLSQTSSVAPKVLFLEKQRHFAWHAGMLLPGAKMQISFIKDMATLRDPRSQFTFLNYLHSKGRLVEFTNLGTFLPARVEYEDYLRWCAEQFEDVVRYGSETLSVSPVESSTGETVREFEVVSRDVESGAIVRQRGRNVILAIGGQPSIPKILPQGHPRVIHSSQYAHRMPQILKDRQAPLRVAIVGGGQSSAEIFNNVQTLYPNSRSYLIMKAAFLKPSDDSPFVNTVFNPDFIDELYPKSSHYRRNLIKDAKATNYGVVRLELLEHIYERMYEQVREIGRDERNWPHRIMGSRRVVSVKETEDGLRLYLGEADADATDESPIMSHPELTNGHNSVNETGRDNEILDVDLVVAATGYRRDGHVEMLRPCWDLLPPADKATEQGDEGLDCWVVNSESSGLHEMTVSRQYKLNVEDGKVDPGSGIWLQGCNEATHGLSDTLLSVLAVRSGEVVESIFGQKVGSRILVPYLEPGSYT